PAGLPYPTLCRSVQLTDLERSEERLDALRARLEVAAQAVQRVGARPPALAEGAGHLGGEDLAAQRIGGRDQFQALQPGPGPGHREAQRAAHPARVGALPRRRIPRREASFVLDVDRRRATTDHEEAAQ